MTRRQKKRTWVFAGVISTLLGAGVLIGRVYAQSLEPAEAAAEAAIPDVLEAEETKEFVTEYTDGEEKTEDTEENLPEDWNLILVNKTHPIPEDYQVELKSIGSGHQIDARAYDDFKAMIQASQNDGVTIYVTSSYRDLNKQIALYEKKTPCRKRDRWWRCRAPANIIWGWLSTWFPQNTGDWTKNRNRQRAFSG